MNFPLGMSLNFISTRQYLSNQNVKVKVQVQVQSCGDELLKLGSLSLLPVQRRVVTAYYPPPPTVLIKVARLIKVVIGSISGSFVLQAFLR